MTGKRSVSSTIYIGRPDLLELQEGLDYLELDVALQEAASSATEITILGGFYSVDPLISLCRKVPKKMRKTCRVRIAVGLDATSAIPKTWTDMRRLKAALKELKFVDPIVAIVDSKPVHFHTKLFRFLHTTHPVWFVGSANPGSARHELMVRLSGKHDALSAYVTAVFGKAVDVEKARAADRVTTLREFFLSGVLCHKPPIHRLFTFDAFYIEPGHRDRLATALAGPSGVSHASPETKGFGFNLRSALPHDVRGDPFATDKKASRTSLTPYSIDTVFGRWMPGVYAQRLDLRVMQGDAARAERLLRVGHALSRSEGQAAVRQAFEDHVSSLKSFLESHDIEAKPVKNREIRFDRFLAARTKSLMVPNMVARYSRSLVFTDMPDIWADGSAVDDFVESFFDDLAYRATLRNRPSIVKSLFSWLDDPTLSASEDFWGAMENGLVERPWTNEDWV